MGDPRGTPVALGRCVPRVSDPTKTTPTRTADDADLTIQRALRGMDGAKPKPEASLNAAMPAIQKEMERRAVPPERAAAAERSLRAYGEAKTAMDQNRWSDAQTSIAASQDALDASQDALPARARSDLAGRLSGSKDLIESRLRSTRGHGRDGFAGPGPEGRLRSTRGHGRDGFAGPGPEGRLRAEGPQGARVPVERDTFERTEISSAPAVAGDAPLPPESTEEVDFTIGTDDTLSPIAVSAQGFERLANRKIYAEIPETSGSLIGKPLPLHLPGKNIDHPPSAEDIFQASLQQLGPGAVSANARYRRETGRNIGYVEITDAQIRGAWNADSKQFDISPAPSRGLVRTINAYNRGGVEAADAERRKISDIPTPSCARAPRKCFAGTARRPKERSRG